MMHASDEPFGTAAYELSTDRYPSGGLDVVSVRGVEQISKPFSFEILLFGSSVDVPSLERDLLGQPATLWMRGPGDVERPIHGILRRVEAEGISGGGEHRHRFRVWLAPRLWLIGRGRNSRIFQDKTVREIIEVVLGESDVDRAFRLAGSYAPRKYCVQHQESDLAFIRRLLAEEGIFYSFDHPPDGRREAVVFCDNALSCEPIAGTPDLVFRDSGGMSERDEDVRRFRVGHRVAPGSMVVSDFDFHRPSLDLHATAQVAAREGAFDASRLRVHEHHGEFEGMAVDPKVAARHLEQHRGRASVGQGESRCRRLLPGRWFSLTNDALPALDGRYTVLRVEHEGYQPEAVRAGGEARDIYKNRFFCVPADVAPRPKRRLRRIQQVMETATVTGPAGHEIHTDEHGRIKVQFHWDREGRKNEHSSCWIRTMQPWAGTGWGFQFIPRIGMEVLVMFLAGDTDRPMVVGATYNAEHPLPFPLPQNKTKSGIRTQTSKGGGGHNEISFEDRAGFERVHVHAQKDHDTVVRHDQTTRIGNNRTDQIANSCFTLVTCNHLTSVGGNLVESVTGDESRTVEGSRSWRVTGNAAEAVHGRAELNIEEDLHTRVGGREQREVEGATELSLRDLTVRVRGNATTLVGRHDQQRSYALHVEGVSQISSTGPTEISSEHGIVIRCGESSLRLMPERIELVSKAIALEAGGAYARLGDDKVKLKAKTEIFGSSEDLINLRASGANVLLSSEAKIEGAKIKLNQPSSESDSSSDEDASITTIELVDDQGNPLPYHRYVVCLEGGEERSGLLDKDGRAEIELDGTAEIVFPGLGAVEPG